MPGFNIMPYGGGYSSQGPSNTTETRRKYRWVFESIGRGLGSFSQAELLHLRGASRPNVKFEPVEMHHNQEKSSYAGKQSWETVKLTWYDIEQDPDVSRGIYHWIETVVNMHSIQVAHPRNYKRTAKLSMIDGAGQITEAWTMLGTWPQESNWQELDYSSNEIQTVEATMSYDRAVRDCIGAPAPLPLTPNCPQI